MRTIWKYELPLDDRVTLTMPAGAHVLCVQLQGGVPTLWAMIDPDTALLERRVFAVVGTGHPVPPDVSRRLYVGTVQQGPFVWHVFECAAGATDVSNGKEG